MPDIVALGEPLIEFNQARADQPSSYLQGFGGDTSNMAIAAARLGARVAYATRLGNDAFGRMFVDLWTREGVDTSGVAFDQEAPTGVYFVTHGPKGHEFSYLRTGSAASRMAPSQLPDALLRAARLVHASGISQAISPSCADAVFAAIRHARASGTTVCYDTNLRLRLWPLDRARAVIHAAVALADIARPGLDDARQLTGRESPDDICDFYLGLGPRIVALTLGKDGTLVATPQERRLVPTRAVEAVDATGAGDTFDGAFLADWLRHGDPFQAAAYANAAAALKTQGLGAVAPIPHRAAVEAFLPS